MPIVNNEVTAPGYPGLGPQAHNVLVHWAGYPKATASANIATLTFSAATSSTSSTASTTTGAGSTITTNISATTWATQATNSTTAGTQPDYCRNLQYVVAGTAASAGMTAGSVLVAGRDLLRLSITESIPQASLWSSSATLSGTLNFGEVNAVSAIARFAALTKGSTQSSDSNGGTTTSSAGSNAPAYTVSVGGGAKLGVFHAEFKRIDAVVYASQNSVAKTTTATSGTNSTISQGNQFSVFTGDYRQAGVSFTSALGSASLIEISFKSNGFGYLPIQS